MSDLRTYLMASAKKTVEKQKTLAETLAELRGKKKEPIGSLDDFEMVPRGLTTGNIVLDALTGIGGLPAGRITELIGPPSSGKTTCALQTIANVQAQGGNIVFLDYERTLDEAYCKALGVKTGDPSFIYVQPDSFEHGANIFRQLLKTGEVHMLAADSVAAMVTEAELNADTGKAEVMQRAKLMHQFLRQIAGPLHKTDCAAVFLNHLMEKADLTPMGQRMAMQGIKKYTSPGGKALPFYSSVRIEFAQMGDIKEATTDDITQETLNLKTQTRTKATVIKNKVGDPFRTAELRVRYGKGFSQAYSVLSVLVNHGVIKKNTTGGYTYPEQLAPSFPVSKGETNQLNAMEFDPAWMSLLTATAVAVLAQQGLEKVDGSNYDKFGNEIVEGETLLSMSESDDLDLSLNTTTGELS